MLERIFDLEPSIAIQHPDSYLESYPYLCAHFSGKAVIEPADVVLGAHMVYGWMPTVLGLNMYAGAEASLGEAARLLNAARRRDLGRDELLVLKGLVNNSIVGASKLLHFVEPARYPIWDSRIFAFVHGKLGHAYQVNSVDAYVSYRRDLLALASHVRFASFHAAVNAKVGYPVSALRALELMMFLAARDGDGRKPESEAMLVA
jgi:hypothetical protein